MNYYIDNQYKQLSQLQIPIDNPAFGWQRVWMFVLLPLFLLTGTARAQTEISNWNDLDDIRNNLTGDYILVNNLSDTTAGYTTVAGPNANGGNGFIPIGDNNNPFRGTLDGDGHLIDSLHISRPTATAGQEGEDAALFAAANGAAITNIGFVNASISAGNGGNGIDGSNGEDGHYEGFDAIDPEPGENGGNGGNGGNAAVLIAVNNGSVIEQSFIADADITAGNGGAGGAGGDGGSGRNGAGGGSSSDGASGGMGGNGGIGGLAGGFVAVNGGNILDSYVTKAEIMTGTGGNGGQGGEGGDGGNSHSSGSHPNRDGGDGGDGGDGNNGGSGGGLAAESAGNVTETYVSDSNIITGIGGTGGTGGAGGPVGDGEYDLGDPVPGEDGIGGINGSDGTAGGLLDTNSGTESNSYFDIAPDNTIGTQLSSANMTGAAAETNMTGFDFNNTWLARIPQNNYPKLLWEVSTATVFGTFTDSLDGKVIQGAQITISPDDDSDVSAADGTYQLELVIGKNYEITATASVDEDFVIARSDTFQADHNKKVDLALKPEYTGEGTAANPFRVETVEDLQQMRYNLSAHYDLQGNLDASITANWFGGKGFQPIGDRNNPFTGSFEGDDNEIDGLTINSPNENFIGLFGQVGSGGRIQNLGLTNVDVSGNRTTGSLVGRNDGQIEDVHVTGEVTADNSNAGGIAAQSFGPVSGSNASVTVSGTFNAGGLVGVNRGPISDSFATGNVSGSRGTVGGLVGNNTSGGAITASHATGDVESPGFNIGGLIGNNTGLSISKSYAEGNVTGGSRTGGFIGSSSSSSTITKSYSTGNVTGKSYTGGFIGKATSAPISKSYSTGNVTGTSFVAGFIGQFHGQSITESFASGNVIATGDKVGGLVGDITSLIKNSYSTGSVKGCFRLGGLTGITTNPFENSYVAGKVISSGDNCVAGAVVGENGGGTFSNIYFDGPLSEQFNAVGSSASPLRSQPQGLETHQMQGASANTHMDGLDFTNTWETVVADVNGAVADGYPILKNIDRQVQLDAQLSISSEVTIEGEAGWRMLSIPLSGQTVEHLADQNQIQGVQGLYSLEDSEGVPTPNKEFHLNFYTGIDETTDLNWTGPINNETVINRGEGFIWFFWDNNIAKSVELPFTLRAKLSGADQQQGKSTMSNDDPPPNPDDPDQNEDFTVSYANKGNGDFILAGNPFTSPIDFDQLSLTDVVAKFWIFDPATDLFVTYNAATGQGNSQIAAWQGFIIQANSNNPEITYPATAQTEGDPTFFKRNDSLGTESPVLHLEIEGHGLSDKNVSALFYEGGKQGVDAGDMAKFFLPSMSGEDLYLYFESSDEHNSQYLTADARPLLFHEPQQFKLNAFGSKPGEYTLSWKTSEWKDGWDVRLIDEATGNEVDMNVENSYTVEMEEIESGYVSQFSMIVSETATDIETPGESVPEKFALNQNYPNPFNPATTIQFALPERTRVSLTVYDLMGREVATLVDEAKAAGRHSVQFDAANMASGVYLYRLETGTEVFTRKMVLIK